MTTGQPWTIEVGDDPIIATAIHAGHDVRDEVASHLQLPEVDRLREEDPFTDHWVGIAENTIVVHRSRFEVDMNRPRDKAIYLTPDDAWGLDIWKTGPSEELVAGSLELYDEFYRQLGQLCDRVVDAHGHVVVLDLHSYNHRRRGPTAPVDDPADNPEINLGTESIPSPHWDAVVARMAETMRHVPFYDATLDVRSNVRFKGGHFSRWLNQRYGERGCSVAIEVKKIYMDEWTGTLDEDISASIGRVLEAAAASVRDELGAKSSSR